MRRLFRASSIVPGVLLRSFAGYAMSSSHITYPFLD
jgi:hypothetical protein